MGAGVSCGSCTECCRGPLALTVNNVAVTREAHCPNVTCSGCSIHATRPDVCRNFECGYIIDNLDISLRPDRCGAIIKKRAEAWKNIAIDDVIPTGDRIPEETLDKLQALYGNTPWTYRWRKDGEDKLGVCGTPEFQRDAIKAYG